MPHGRHICAKSYDMAKVTMCSYPQSDHTLPHCKYVLQCCAKFPSVNLPDQETDYRSPNTSPSIIFLIARCTQHGRLPLTEKKYFHMCKQDTAS